MTFASEVCVPVTVAVVSYTPPVAGRYCDVPERCAPREPPDVELRVTLGEIDITAALSSDVLDDLRDQALEQLAEP